jgi:TolB protein
MTRTLRPVSLATAVAALALAALGARSQPPAQPPPTQPPASQQPPPQPTELSATITSDAGTGPRFAVPDFIALSRDAETAAIARTIGQVLWDDLAFEREFALIPRDIYATIPAATSFSDVAFDRWRELNADGVVIGTVQKTGTTVRVEVRLFNLKNQQTAFGKEYNGSAANPRLYAHTIADEIHKQQRALRGVALTKLTFDSDRDGERMTGTVEKRGVKEIYIADYDGENQRRVTTGRSLNITPAWSPDGRSIAYTSYRHGSPTIFISHIFEGTLDEFPKAIESTFQPSWSPDGTRIAFWSTRDGNAEIYVANRDGSNVRRLTNHPGIDESPTWNPAGTQIAFVSDRTGAPQIYIIGVDGLGLQKITSELYCDRPTWSPAPFNEIAFTSKTGPGNDIKVKDLASGQVRQLTFGEGTNESPAFSPNGRHLAFMSTRSGKSQIFTMARDGKDMKQITKSGNNQQPDWSK